MGLQAPVNLMGPASAGRWWWPPEPVALRAGKRSASRLQWLILTERTAHVELLAGKLREKIPEVITLTGGRGVKEIRNILARIAATPAGEPLTLVATGRYIGEGFDEPRLDTLFLAMPKSSRGTLQQYAGRLH